MPKPTLLDFKARTSFSMNLAYSGCMGSWSRSWNSVLHWFMVQNRLVSQFNSHGFNSTPIEMLHFYTIDTCRSTSIGVVAFSRWSSFTCRYLCHVLKPPLSLLVIDVGVGPYWDCTITILARGFPQTDMIGNKMNCMRCGNWFCPFLVSICVGGISGDYS